MVDVHIALLLRFRGVTFKQQRQKNIGAEGGKNEKMKAKKEEHADLRV